MTKSSFANKLVEWEVYIKDLLKQYNSKTGDDVEYEDFCKHLMSEYDKQSVLVVFLEKLLNKSTTPENADTRIPLFMQFFMMSLAVKLEKEQRRAIRISDHFKKRLSEQEAADVSTMAQISDELYDSFISLLKAYTYVSNILLTVAIRVPDSQYSVKKRCDRYIIEIPSSLCMLTFIEHTEMHRFNDVMALLMAGIEASQPFLTSAMILKCELVNGKLRMTVNKDCYDKVMADRKHSTKFTVFG